MSTSHLIDTLVRDLQPVERPIPSLRACLLWLVAGWTAVFAITWLTGPFRTGGLQDVLQSPRFALEGLVGLAVGAVGIQAALASGLPGAGRIRRLAAPLGLLVAVWIGLYLIGLLWPALPPAMDGKRAHCSIETLVLSALPLAGAFWIMRRRLPLHPRWTGLLLGAAAGSLPALIMQWACMYDPAHMLVNHLGPAAGVAGVGWLLAPRCLPRV